MGRDFLTTYVKFFVLLAILALFWCGLTACAAEGRTVVYAEQEHTCAFGRWSDAAPEGEGALITHEVRYCKVCHAEETRVKE